MAGDVGACEVNGGSRGREGSGGGKTISMPPLTHHAKLSKVSGFQEGQTVTSSYNPPTPRGWKPRLLDIRPAG